MEGQIPAAETEQEVNEHGNVVGEKVEDKEAGLKRTALSDKDRATPVADIASELNAEEVGENQYKPKNIHHFRNKLAQRGHAVDFNEETGVATVREGEGPQFNVGEKPEFSVGEAPAKPASDRAGVIPVKDGKIEIFNPTAKGTGKTEIAEADIYNKAAEGQVYTREPFYKATGQAAELAGGKGGFGSQGDARDAVGSFVGGQQQSPADFMRMIENLHKFGKVNIPQSEIKNALAAIREEAGRREAVVPKKGEGAAVLAPVGVGNISYGAIKGVFKGLHNNGEISTESLNQLRESYDKMAGYKGAHKNLDNTFALKTVNELNLPLKKKKKKGPSEAERTEQKRKDIIAGKRKPEGSDLRRTAGQSGLYDIPIVADKNLEPNIKLGKDVTEREGTGEFEESFDRRDVGESVSPRQDLRGKGLKGTKASPLYEQVDQALETYNAGDKTDNQLIQDLGDYVLNNVPKIATAAEGGQKISEGQANFEGVQASEGTRGYNRENVELQGFALDRLAQQVKDGKFKGLTGRQAMTKAKAIAKSAKAQQREAYGESRDRQRLSNVARRAEQAFYALQGYDPSNTELADYINANRPKYKIKKDVTADQIELAQRGELPVDTGARVEGTAKETAQTRIAQEAGLDQVTDEVLTPQQVEAIDIAAETILAQSPEIASPSELQDINLRRGATFDETVKGDKAAAKIRKAATEINKDLKEAIGASVKGDAVAKAYETFGQDFGFGNTPYNSLDRAQKQNFRRKLIDGLAQEAESRLAGKTTPSPEFSLENRNPNFSGFEFDAGRTTSQRVQNAVTPFLRNSRQRLRGDKFSSVLTHRSPEKKAAVKRAARETGANIVDHPLNPGEVLVLAPGKTLNDVLKFNTSRNGKAIDLDPRDFTTFNESATPDKRQYTNLNINDLISNINSRQQYLNNNNNWGKLNKITQLQPNDINNIKRSLIDQGFNVQESVDAKGDPTIVFSKGRINPDWSIKDVHAPAKELATPEWSGKVTDALKTAFPGYNVIGTKNEFHSYKNQLERDGYEVPKGNVKGLVFGNTIAINPEGATKDTHIHEFGHVWAKELQRSNPKLWMRGRELLKNTPYMEVVDNNPVYRSYRERGDNARFHEEVMANALGKRGAEIFARNSQKAGMWDKFRKKVGTWLKDKLNISSKKDYADLTLDDWLDIGAHSILTGDKAAFKAPTSKANIEFNLGENVKNPDVKDKAAAMDVSERAAAYADKNRSVAERLKNWVVPPSADDFHGLAQRFKRKFPKSELGKKMNTLIEKYENDYHNYEKAATKVRDDAKLAMDNLAKGLGMTPKKIAAHLSAPTDVNIEGIPASILELISNYDTNNDAKNYINNNPSLKEFYNNINNIKFGNAKMEISPDRPFQASLLDFINKGLLKENLSDFLAYKKENFGNLSEVGKMGSGYLSAFNDSLSRMSGNTGRGTDSITGPFSEWLQGSVGTIMFLNVRSAGLQFLSTWNFMSPSNIIGFNRDLAGTLVKGSPQRKLFTRLWNDSMLKERRARAGFDVNAEEILDAVKDGKFQKTVGKVLNKGFYLTSMMDSVAIAAGGVGFVNQEIKSGSTPSEALAKWRKQTQEAQQSARPDRVSQQQKSAVSKFILAFANTPQQYFRLSQKAFRAIQDKGITSPEGKTALRKIAYYTAIQNAIFTMLQSTSMALFMGWDSDDDDTRKEAENQLNSMSDTVLRGMGLLGAVVAAGKNTVLNAVRESDKARPDYGKAILKGTTSVAPPLSRKINDIQAIGNAYKYDSGKTGFRSKEAIAGSRAITAALNVPADWPQKKLAAVQAYLEEEELNISDLMLMLYGKAEYAVLKDKESTEDFDFDDFDFDDVDFEDFDFDDEDFN